MSDKPVYHGRDHRFGGADPIHPDGGEDIRFDFDNDGAWLDIETNDTGPGGAGVVISDTSPGIVGIDINALGQIQIGSPLVSLGPALVVVSPDAVDLTVGGSSVGGVITVNIGNGSGTKFRVLNGVTALLEVRDDNTFHILTGAAWVADL